MIPVGEDLDPPPALAQVRDFGDADFGMLFAASVNIGGGPVEQVALPGVQEKVSAAMISFPGAGQAPGGHISSSLNPPTHPRLVENEAFFMAMAAASGLPVAVTNRAVMTQGGRNLSAPGFAPTSPGECDDLQATGAFDLPDNP